MSPDDTDEIDKESLDQDLQELKSMIDNFKALGVNVEAVETILNQAIKNLDENPTLSFTLFESAKETYKLIKQQYFIQASSILFSSLQRTVLELESAGQDVDNIKDLYNKAKDMFDAGQYEEAMGYVKSAEDMASDLKEKIRTSEAGVTGEDADNSKEQMELVSKTLIRVDELLQKAIDSGYAINEAEKLYSLAEDAFDYQDYKKAESYALEAEKSLKNILEPSYDTEESEAPDEDVDEASSASSQVELDRKKKFSDIVPMGIIGDAPNSRDEDTIEKPDSKSSISDLKADLKRIMERVPTKRKVKKPKKLEFVEGEKKRVEENDEPEPETKFEAEEDIASVTKPEIDLDLETEKPEIEALEKTEKPAKKEYIEPELELSGESQEQAEILMNALENKIKLAGKAGLNVPMAERLFSIAESYHEGGEYESVIEYTKKGIKNINDLATRKGIAEKVSLKATGEPLETEQEEPGPTLEPISKKSFEGVPEVEEISEENEPEGDTEPEAKKKKKKKKVNKQAAEKIKIALKKISSEIKATREMGIPVEGAQELIKKAVEELRGNNLAEAKDIGIQARNMIKDIKADFIRQKALDIIKVAWKEIEEAKANGLDISKANKLLQRARNQIKKENYEKAASFAMKALNLLK
jgi:tetratricopeptide (TPR) repeat protein